MARRTTRRTAPATEAAVPAETTRREDAPQPARSRAGWYAAADAPAAEASVDQLLTFLMGRDEYGISILRVREIAEYRTLTPVPMRPGWMRGVMNLRGTVVPVIDLAARLGLPETSISRRTCLVIVDFDIDSQATVNESDRMIVAVMVDAVSRVIEVRTEDIQEAPPFGLMADIVPGLVRVDGELIVLLDLSAIVSGGELNAAANLLPSLRESEAGA